MIYMLRSGVLFSILICAFPIYGQTYNKCSDLQGKVSFTDKPCPVGSVNVMTIEPAYPPAQIPAPSGVVSSNSSQRYLDMKVDEAIGTGDLRRAKDLALTPEHWEKIRVSETAKPKNDAEIQNEMAKSESCKISSRNYELAAYKVDSFNGEFVAAKKRTMYSACGMKEPSNTNIYIFR